MTRSARPTDQNTAMNASVSGAVRAVRIIHVTTDVGVLAQANGWPGRGSPRPGEGRRLAAESAVSGCGGRVVAGAVMSSGGWLIRRAGSR